MQFIIKGQIKDFFRKNNLRVSIEAYEALDAKIEKLLFEAVERARKNKRTTVMKWDL